MYLTRLAALHTVLCYLCSVNASHETVEDYLTSYPEALLFEGVSALPEEASIVILEKLLAASGSRNHGPHSKGGSAAKNNLVRLRSLVQREFLYFKERQRSQVVQTILMDPGSLIQLSEWESKLIKWRQMERHLRLRILEESVIQGSLGCRRGCWKCVKLPSTSGTKMNCDIEAFQLKEAQIAVLRQIKQARQRQYQILKQVFALVPRYDA